MRPREFMTLFGGAAAVWPLAAHAQKTPVVGFLNAGSATLWEHLATRSAMDWGRSATRSVKIEYRWADGDYDRLPGLATKLVGRQVAIIASGGGDRAALAAKAATTTIPIVFTSGSDPVKSGLVSSSRTSGNLAAENLTTPGSSAPE
jgi:putative tryptophan/tyrosine transport system substrate-binding protein